MGEVSQYRKCDQSDPGGSEPPTMRERRRRHAIRKKVRPHRMRKSDLGEGGSGDDPLDHSVEESGNQSQDK